MHHGFVSYRAIPPDNQRRANIRVKNAVLLNIRASADDDRFIVPAHNSPEPDAGITMKFDTTDQNRIVRDEMVAVSFDPTFFKLVDHYVRLCCCATAIMPHSLRGERNVTSRFATVYFGDRNVGKSA